jgi:hypothetical protein
MPLSFAELEIFYHNLVTRARDRGVTCAITSGMACVTFGVAATTKDCDLLCAPGAARHLFDLLCETVLAGRVPSYRGNLSAPLDERWLRGGWTSHFVWDAGDAEAYLDVFGVPPRGSSPWEDELHGFYVSRHTVAEMKRTNRERDWPYATALGAQMLEAGDERGWLHIFDEPLLLSLIKTTVPPSHVAKRRPALGLALQSDPRLRAALHAELQFWHELDRIRMGIYQKAARPYLQAVKRARNKLGASLPIQHEVRARCAQAHLPLNPLTDFGVDRMIQQARIGVAELVNPAALPFLPDVRDHFRLPQ